MQNINLYATVYNNVTTIEESIKSIFDSSYEITIVDNYSNDGTWEKLNYIKKDYNLKLYQYKSSRGKGRDYALKHTTEGSYTAYFDLDNYYNSNFHKLLNYGYSQGKKTIASLYSLMILRDPLLGKGGWRNLYTAEDSEIFARIKSDYYVPAIPFINGYPSENNSESRYAKHFKYYVRRIRLGVDLIRGEGFTLDDTFNYFKFYYKANPFFTRLALSSIFTVGKFKKIYKYDKNVNNSILENRQFLDSFLDTKEVGILDDYFCFPLERWAKELESSVELLLHKLNINFIKYIDNVGTLIFVKNEEGLKNFLKTRHSQNFTLKKL